ncbi:D-aspartate oxidase [Sporothrix bragantina]|uniref:D-aspartate oxidase n=1 Tax=Sporothrix bragantina TaxID=671064 RepID=A0ABP0AP88_9PEZI
MATWEANDSIVILGAGIIGLDVALVLARKGLGPLITVVAEYLPGDTAPDYTSPWAGCNYSSISGSDANALRWDRLGYRHLLQLATQCSAESYVARTSSTEIWDDVVPNDKIKIMSEYLENFSVMTPEQLPTGAAFGVTFNTITLHAPKHLQWLYTTLQTAGVTFVRRTVPDLPSAAGPNTKILFNCIGNAAMSFPGVQDAKCYPTRGQVLLVRAPGVKRNMMRYGKGYITYVIPRPLSNNQVILGGYLQKNVGNHATYDHETRDILKRTTALSTELASCNNGQGPEVLGVASGLRPSREGGARVERTELNVNGKALALVHNYGAGGTGYQAGYGMALDAVRTIEQLLPTQGMTASL